jgi:hypothetical protein
MSQASRKFFDAAKQPPQEGIGAIEAAKEGILAIFPGMRGMGSEMANELKRLAVQGSAELAGALFNGHAYVPYGQGQTIDFTSNEGADTPPAPQRGEQEKEQERGGREM